MGAQQNRGRAARPAFPLQVPPMSTHANAAEAYLASSVENAPPIKIVRMLYQGALRFLLQAESESASDPRSKFLEHCSSADAIVAELRLSLDKDRGAADVVANLTQLYLFCESELQKCMIERSKAPIPGVRRVLKTLLEAWDHVEIQSARR